MTNNKIIFLDIDCTFITREEKLVPHAVEACQRARAKGHKLFICTGRPRVLVGDYILNVGFDGMISSAGACIDYGGKTLYKKPMPVDLVKRIESCMKKQNFPYFFEYSDSLSLSQSPGPDLMKWFDDNIYAPQGRGHKNYPIPFIEKLREFLDVKMSYENVNKIMFYNIEGPESAGLKNIKNELGGECNIIYQAIGELRDACMEINSKETNKGSAIEILIDKLGISREDTVAFGDGDNDIQMFDFCHTKVAMGNASPALKQRASFITDAVDNDGLYKGFEHIGLI